MKKYYISIVEYLTKTIEVEAANKEEAKAKINKAYRGGFIKLTSRDNYYVEPFQVIDQDEVHRMELPFEKLKDIRNINLKERCNEAI